MSQIISTAIPYGVLFSHVILVGLIFAFIFRRTWGKDVFEFVGKNSISLAFLVSLMAVGGSLFYSQIIGFEPCVLCWWQRVFIFPTMIVLGVSLYKKLPNVWSYVFPLIILALMVAAYQTSSDIWGISILPCTAQGGGCDRIYVKAFGYITIPTMSLTTALYFLTFYLFDRSYKSR
jgi:disulfide bond formation protein DsbB